jgi:hypothetical protein
MIEFFIHLEGAECQSSLPSMEGSWAISKVGVAVESNDLNRFEVYLLRV